MAVFQRMNRLSKFTSCSSIKSYSPFSSNLSTHRYYGRISKLLKPNGSCSFFSFNTYHLYHLQDVRGVSEIVRPDGYGGFTVDKTALVKCLQIAGIPVKDVDTIVSHLEDNLKHIAETECSPETTADGDPKKFGKWYEEGVAALDEKQLEIDEFNEYLDEVHWHSTKSYVTRVVSFLAVGFGLCLVGAIQISRSRGS